MKQRKKAGPKLKNGERANNAVACLLVDKDFDRLDAYLNEVRIPKSSWIRNLILDRLDEIDKEATNVK